MLEKKYLPNLDTQELSARVGLFKEIIFPDIYKVTQGKISEEVLKNTARALDLGMGKGALGLFLKKLNPKVALVGVDIQNYQGREETAYTSYQKRFEADLTQEDFWQQLAGEPPFDLIISVGLPFAVIEILLKKREKLENFLAPEGKCLIVSDDDWESEEVKPFTLYQGHYPLNRSILLWVL
jgi:SAM-dependent methyltransferase